MTKSEHKIRFLLRSLRFDNIHDRVLRKVTDKLAPIREFMECLVSNYQKFYTPSEYLKIDEQLVIFRGRCSFRQYIPSKPAKYGLKVFALVDCKTAYTSNLEIYVGKQPTGPYELDNSPKEVVLRLVKAVESTNRNITGDNWFLLKILLTDKKLTHVGTIQKNKREILREFLPTKNRADKTSIFRFHIVLKITKQ